MEWLAASIGGEIGNGKMGRKCDYLRVLSRLRLSGTNNFVDKISTTFIYPFLI